MRAAPMTVAAIEAAVPQANAIFADTRADIARIGAPASRHDAAWYRKDQAVWTRFVVRMLGYSADKASPAALDALRELFTELGAVNTGARLMAAWDAADAAALPLTFCEAPCDTAERDRQRARLQANSPQRAMAAQLATCDLPLFAAAQQPSLF